MKNTWNLSALTKFIYIWEDSWRREYQSDFRIQRVKKDTELSPLPITEELWDLSLCTISLTKTHLMLFKIGKGIYQI